MVKTFRELSEGDVLVMKGYPERYDCDEWVNGKHYVQAVDYSDVEIIVKSVDVDGDTEKVRFIGAAQYHHCGMAFKMNREFYFNRCDLDRSESEIFFCPRYYGHGWKLEVKGN